jgi:acyl-CoA reductase-like NAD-dependent aldehyde dehydrogenase
MNIYNPASGKIIKTIKEDSSSEVKKKYNLAKKGQQKWAQKSLKQRISIIEKFNSLLEKEMNRLATTLTAEVGKPITQAVNEIKGARHRINYFIKNSEKYLADEIVYSDEKINEQISYEPLGVICNISAWNYPYLVGVNVFIPALIAGNSVIYKPSEYATLTGLEIEQLLYKAGVPNDVFICVTGEKKTGEALLNLPFNGYFFTGSYKTGKYIYEKVSEKMVPCQLELGGKDPVYISADNKNIETVAAATADGAFYNNGQSCCAVERIYVNSKVYDRYITAFVNEVKSFSIGNPMEKGTYIGPLTRKEQIGFLEYQIEDAIKKGAKILCGGKKIKGNGYYFEPTVLINVNHKMNLMKEESFGPVIGIQKVKNDEEAIALMQDTEYGLTASVYSDNETKAKKILRSINAGTGYWNCCDRVSPYLPWSGRKNSGMGATLSHIGIRAFTKPKAFHLRKK